MDKFKLVMTIVIITLAVGLTAGWFGRNVGMNLSEEIIRELQDSLRNERIKLGKERMRSAEMRDSSSTIILSHLERYDSLEHRDSIELGSLRTKISRNEKLTVRELEYEAVAQYHAYTDSIRAPGSGN